MHAALPEVLKAIDGSANIKLAMNSPDVELLALSGDHATDGTVEALELPGTNLLAVRWHPEDNAEVRFTDQVLFDWLVTGLGCRHSRGIASAG